MAGRTHELAYPMQAGLAPAPQGRSQFHFTYTSALHKRGPPSSLA